MRKLMKMTSLVLVLLFAGSMGFAQIEQQQQESGDISDNELKEFISLQQTIQEINQQGQQKMVKAIEDHNMTVQRYQEIAKARQQGEEPEMTPEESKGFKAADKVVTEEQQNMQTSMDESFDGSDMTKERYIEINRSVSQDAALQERMRNLQQEAN